MHVSLQYLTPVLPCVLSPVVVSPVSPPFPSCALSLCLQEEGVVSFCKVCAIGLVNTPSHHLPNDTKKARPLLPQCLPTIPPRSYASHPTPSSSMCHRAYGIWITHHPSGQATQAHHPRRPWDSGSTHPIPFFIFSLLFFFNATFLSMANLEWYLL